jgi:hypothetical protein
VPLPGTECRALDHAVNPVASRHCLIQRTQHDHAGAFAKYGAVGIRAKWYALSIRRQNAESAERAEPIGIENQIHAADDRASALSCAQRIAREVQRRGRR